ncbi:hypothetical protein AcV5_002320 [Taiwanofungus camphoratus]|nr:hypothetical protein AcV5_002320 [Antrodia cinnamomea]
MASQVDGLGNIGKGDSSQANRGGPTQGWGPRKTFHVVLAKASLLGRISAVG